MGGYLKEYCGEVPGIAYGSDFEEIAYARRTMPDLHEFIMHVRRWGQEITVERFARDSFRHGKGQRVFDSGLLVRNVYSKFHDGKGNQLDS